MQPRHGCGASASRSPRLVRPHRGGVRAAPLLYIIMTTLKNLGRERAHDHERGTNAGSSRHGSHRRRLGGARAALRHRRRGRGLEARDGGLDPRRGRQRRRGALATHAGTAAAQGEALLHHRSKCHGAAGGFHPGEHSRAAAAEAAGARGHEPPRAARRRDRFQHLGSQTIGPAAGDGGARALPGGASLQSRVPVAAGGAGRRPADRRRGPRCGRPLLHPHRHASAQGAPRGAGTPDRPAAGGAVARDPAHGERGCGHHRRARRLHRLRSRAALGRDGHQPDLSPRGRRDRYAPHAHAVRTRPQMAVDQARGPGAHRGADRQDGGGHAGAGRRPLDPRARAFAR